MPDILDLRDKRGFVMRDLNFLIWNVRSKGRGFQTAVAELYNSYKPDFFLLVESDFEDHEVEALTNLELKSVMRSDKKSIRLYANKGLNIHNVHEEEGEDGRRRQIRERLIFFNLEVNGTKIVLVGVHFPSKLNHSKVEQYNIMRRWLRWIETQEELFGTEHSILFGDLNLNPFDSALYRPGGLDSHPTVKHLTRVKPRYYNPMWSTLGDFIYGSDKPKIPGTHFFDIDEDRDEEFHWNAVDGVLIKKSLEHTFVRKELEIITKTENHTFASSHEIYSKKYSDHLPVKFKIRVP